ncbi:hypothetical protein [Bacillus thuringiensis]|uniref:hypothetical protein n=1 Tax=Bacillus thuringiensis TaxID=1428 RepID=UPI0020D282A7|nr:hypothetical protein [Bacillus thuringiensis]
MEDYKCRACGKIAAEGFALGRLCYYCIEEVVIHIKKQIEGKEISCRQEVIKQSKSWEQMNL